MLSSMAKLWPANFGHLGLHWILGLFRYLHVTFLKSFPLTRIGQQRLDEIKSPVREDDDKYKARSSSSSSSSSSSAAPVRERVVSSAVESRLVRAPTQVDRRTRRGGKEMTKKGKANGKAQAKQKMQKLQRNETEPRFQRNPDLQLCQSISELENSDQEHGAEVKNMEEECFEDCEGESLPLNENCDVDNLGGENNSVELIASEDVGEVLSEIIPYQVSHGQKSSDAVQLTMAPVETVSKETGYSGRNRSRKNRRKGRVVRQMPLIFVSTPAAQSHQPDGDEICGMNSDLVGMSSESPMSSVRCVASLPAVNCVLFGGGSALGNCRQKPSARVHPSRSTPTTDCALKSSDNGLSPEIKASVVDFLSVNSKSDGVDTCGAPVELYQNSRSILSCVARSEGSKKMQVVNSLSCMTANSDQRSYDSGIDVRNDMTCLDFASESHHMSSMTASTFYEFPHIGKSPLTRPRPRNLVNPFSLYDSTAGLRRAEVKPSYVEPPRFRPRSMVNPLPARLLPSRTGCNAERSASELASASDSVELHVARTARANDSRVLVSEEPKNVNEREERWASTAATFTEESSCECAALNSCSDSFPPLDDHQSHGIGDQSSLRCHVKGILEKQELSHSAVPLIHCRSGRSHLESNPIRAPRRHAVSKQPLCTKTTLSQGPVLVPVPARMSSPSVCHDFKNSRVKENGLFGKKTNPRNLPKSGKSVGFRTSVFKQDSIKSNESREANQRNFDLWRARQFLYAEFLTIVEKQKQNNRDVVIFKCSTDGDHFNVRRHFPL